MEEIIGKQVSYWDLLPLELQEYIQTLAIHQHVNDRLHMGWEVIHDSFRPCVFCEKLLDSQPIVLSNDVKFLLPRWRFHISKQPNHFLCVPESF